MGVPERYLCPANCGKKTVEIIRENYRIPDRWRGGGEWEGRKQVVCSQDSILHAGQRTPIVYSANVVSIYTCDVKRCGGPGWNTVNVRSLNSVTLKSVQCKCWRYYNLNVLLQIIYLESLSGPSELCIGEVEHVSFYVVCSEIWLPWVSVIIKQNE